MLVYPVTYYESAESAFDPSKVTSASVYRWLRKGEGLYQEENSGLGSTVSGTGDVVGRWEDYLLGNAGRLSQGTTSLKPLAQADGSIEFDGVDDLLDGDWSGLSTSGLILIRVKIQTDPPASAGTVGLWVMGTGNTALYPWINGNIYGSALSTTRHDNIPVSEDLTQWQTYSVSSKANEWIARVGSNIILNDATNTFASPPATTKLGAGGGSESLDGNVKELVIFDDVPSAADLTSLLTYMAAL